MYRMIQKWWGTVSLWYQDGTPFLKENGEPAKSSALQSDGTVLFEGLQAIIPEAGERIFVGVDILPMVQSQKWINNFATIPASSSETRILGYWSQKEMLLSSNIPPKSNPSFSFFEVVYRSKRSRSINDSSPLWRQ